MSLVVCVMGSHRREMSPVIRSDELVVFSSSRTSDCNLSRKPVHTRPRSRDVPRTAKTRWSEYFHCPSCFLFVCPNIYYTIATTDLPAVYTAARAMKSIRHKPIQIQKSASPPSIQPQFKLNTRNMSTPFAVDFLGSDSRTKIMTGNGNKPID